MSIVIKGVEMPKESWECPCHNGETGRCKVTGRSCCDIPKDCPLIEIQTPPRMSDDTISRQAAIDAINTYFGFNIEEEYGSAVQEVVNGLPSAQPETGKWLEVEVFPVAYDIEGVKTWASELQCEQCGFRHTAIEGHMAQYNFCPNCGAKMEVQDE